MSLFGTNSNNSLDSKDVNPISPVDVKNSSNQPSTVIAKGVKLEGEFKSQGDVLVEGEVSGTIETENSLNVGNEAFVKAGVQAGNALIAGRVQGNLKIKKHLDLKSSAVINGDIICETITVESGAKINGAVRCGRNDDKMNNKIEQKTSSNNK